jgi:hypothetical protein
VTLIGETGVGGYVRQVVLAAGKPFEGRDGWQNSFDNLDIALTA